MKGAGGFVLPLRPGLTAIVGENDNGKTAVIPTSTIKFAPRARGIYMENYDMRVPVTFLCCH